MIGPKSLQEFLQDLAAAQQTALEQQRSYNEALRSVISRLTSLCHQGYFTFADRPGQWISVNSILEVLEGAREILDRPEASANPQEIVSGLGEVLKRIDGGTNA